MAVRRVPRPQHPQGRVPDTRRRRTSRRAPRRPLLHQAGFALRVPSSPDAPGGHAQDGVPHPRRALRVPGDVVQALQCSGDVPGADE